MADTIDRIALQLEEQIQSVMGQIEGQSEYAWLHGKMLLISGKLSIHHWKYRDAVSNSRHPQIEQQARAIVACEREFRKALRPPGALDIDVEVGL